MRPVFIYALNCPVTGETRYCGQTFNPDVRLSQHISRAPKQKHYNARWIASLSFKNLRPVMEILDVVPDTEADFWEREYIQNFRERGFNLTNFSDGGDLNPFLGKKHSPETCAKISEINTGKKRSLEYRAAKSAASTGEKNHFFGKKHSLETKEKLRAARLGTKQSPETVAKKIVAISKRQRDERGRLL